MTFTSLLNVDGLILEFGVARGGTLRQIAYAIAPKTVYGFDWFKGLPEDWGPHPKGDYACDIPELPYNAELIVGLFQDTLKPFLETHKDPIGFVHIDCDLYSSTSFVLKTLGNRLKGATIVFDEIRGAPHCENHEGKALKDFLASHNLTAEHLGNHHEYGSAFRL